jgi:hypothetical protein
MTAAPHVRTLCERLDMANAAPRCGARRKHDGCPCQAPAMANGRCRFHGGKSTGPRTPAGLERCRAARLKHGYYTAEAVTERAEASASRRALRACLAEIGNGLSLKPVARGRTAPLDGTDCSTGDKQQREEWIELEPSRSRGARA